MNIIFIITSALAAPAVEEIVVTATRTERARGDSPVATEVIDREEIEASGAEDVADLLSQHPGVTVDRSYLGATVQLRGLGAEHVLVLVDGQRVAGRAGDAVDLSRFPVEAIERVEIVKGPGSVLYGSDALAGVIHIVTRAPSEPMEGSLHARYGTRATADGAVGFGAAGDAWSGRLDAGYHRDAPFDLDETDPATTGSGAEQLQLDGRLDLEPTADLDLGLRGAWTRIGRDGVDLSEAGAIFDRTHLTEEARFAVEPRLVTDARGTVSVLAAASLFRDQYLLDQRGGAALDDYQDTRETVAQLQLQADRVHGRHTLSFGVDALAEWLVSERLTDGRGARRRVAAFAQDEIALLGDRLALLPSARLDVDTAFGVCPTGRLAARFDATDRVTVRGATGTGYRAPSFREMYLWFENPSVGYRVEGNPALSPERSVHGSVGVEWTVVDGAWVGLTAFQDELADLITVGTLSEGGPDGPVRYGYVNVASARSRGAELSVELEPAELVSLDLSGTFTDTLDRERGGPLEGRARLQGHASLSLRTASGDTRGTVRAGFTGPRPFYLDDGAGGETTEIADPYALVDLKLSQRVGPVSLQAGVENLLDAGDPDFLAIPPRLFWAGVDGRLPTRDRRGEP